MPLQQTSGNATADAFGSGEISANYIEDVFSAYTYTGNGSTQTITNGIDLAGKGGLVWMKGRSGATSHALYDTARGATLDLVSNSTAAQTTQTTGLTSFGATGFSIGALAKVNTNASTYVSWTFRKQPKFFDIVAYTGNGVNSTIFHSLKAVPGCIIVKRTDTASNWPIYHRGLTSAEYVVYLNSNGIETSQAAVWNSTPPTGSLFSVGTSADTNALGGTYVAYLFAHDAGGFGSTGSENAISCGVVSAGSTIAALGWEPQFVMDKSVSIAFDWLSYDSARGLVAPNETIKGLYPNDIASENSFANAACSITASGMSIEDLGAGTNRIYIAIRRGPMRVPVDGTKVFTPMTRTGTGATAVVTGVGFTPDLLMDRYRTVGADTVVSDRLRGINPYMSTDTTTSEAGFGASGNISFNMDGITLGPGAPFNASGNSYINWFFQRAPGFFDEVCYTGTGVATTQAHNLTTVPTLMLVKQRSGVANDWRVYSAALANTQYLALNSNSAVATNATIWNSTTPTGSVFSIGTSSTTNTVSERYLAYLFATCPGVSKVGSYTGTGATQTIDCGFVAGARFVIIKRTNGTGDWYVWDTARGMVAGTDPSLLLNSTAAEVNVDSVYTATTGFQIVSTAAGINASGGSYIFLAVA